MNSKKLSLVLLILTLFTSCSNDVLRNSISYELIEEGHLSYSEEEQIPERTLVFKNEAEWQDFLPKIERVNPHRAQKFEELNFDFSENDLVLIIGKFYYYCCSKILISGVYNENGNMVVDYSETGPGEATALSQAYVLLKIKKVERD